MNNALGLITIVAGIPGLGALMLIGLFPDFPLPAKMVVINSFVLRGLCGVVGGVLLFRGHRWGYYLTLIAWLYLVTVSMLTIMGLFDKGLILSLEFLKDNYAAFGRPFARSVIKLILGVPIIYLVFRDLRQRLKFKDN